MTLKITRWALISMMAPFLLGTVVQAGEKEVRQAVDKNFAGIQPKSVRQSSFDPNWFEVVIRGEIVYVEKNGRYLMSGSVFDLSNRRNLTEDRREQISRVDIKTLPLASAIKRVQGNGKRVLITFEDPYCGYCKKLNTELKKLKDVTIYTFLYPVISPKSPETSKQIWCSADRNKAWEAVLTGGPAKLGKPDCKNPINELLALGQRLEIASVPTIIFPDGSVLAGYRSAKDIEAKLTSAGAKK